MRSIKKQTKLAHAYLGAFTPKRHLPDKRWRFFSPRQFLRRTPSQGCAGVALLRLCVPIIAAVAMLAGVFLHLQTISTQGVSYWHILAPYPLASERFGVGGSAGQIREDQWQALSAGWYVPWGTLANPGHPNGVAILQTIRIDGDSPVEDEETITAIVRANPGAVWRVGSEPDSPWQDSATPQQYARVYHHLYHLVKAEDPSAHVAFGGLVQATPLRLLYLEQTWQAYLDAYGVPMPVDVWTVHNFILPETVTGWGAGIPPGMGNYAHLGMTYAMRDHDDVGIFSQRVRDLRQWMADHGQRDKPLLVPEFGCLLWPIMLDEDGQDFSDERVIAFMVSTFDFFLAAADPDLGYPADGNRLVQAWAWYSLDDDVYRDGQLVGEGYGGDLFTGAYTKTMTALGEAYATYVQPLTGEPYTDLWPLQLHVEPGDATWGATAMLTLTAEFANHGRQPAQNVTLQLWDGEPGAGGTPAGAPAVVPAVPGRYEGTGLASVTWTTLVSGTPAIWMDVDPTGQVTESDESNNLRAFPVSLEVDLSPVGLQIDPPIPLLAGDVVSVTVTATVTNAGPVRSPAAVDAWLWVGDVNAGRPTALFALESLAAGQGMQLAAELTFDAAGPHPITLQVDPKSVVVDADEGNNSLSSTLLVAISRQFMPHVLANAQPPVAAQRTQ